MSFIGSGSTLGFAALVKCAALNFPANRGVATSVPVAAFGLSAFFLSGVASIISPGDTYGLLCILSFLPMFLFIITLPFIKVLPLEYVSANVRTSSEKGSLCINLPVISEKEHSEPSSSPRRLYSGSHALTDSPIDIYGTRLLRTKTFWLHFFLLGTLAGVGQMYIYSCGYCVRALIEDPESNAHALQKLQSVQVGTISLTSFSGRIMSGFLSDYIHNKHHLPRTLILIASASIMLVAQASAFSVTSASSLWIPSAATGLAYGICYGSYPTIVSDTFGMRYFSQNWGFLALSPVPTSYILNMMFGALYDVNSTVDEAGHRVCALGKDCYSRSFIITSGAITTALLVLVPYVMTRKRR
ncbi:hypothetical protein AWJ20_2083 [Sugiyamaella lignohabitans]|uniref:Nodulin-like domain-containing protein n=1 Tax=Sugiyamaella lignohabitans TaxID=796027 RepID=A0A161HFU5_9ASCO|nr:uncharacterized protein AWJ20_2083 [Sugiyamaella lignohabitans]ANB14490.1 hypothetical protein AWJ20_2083 [Sugiyamaella lignohabitans]